jgi:hypothetical protein
VSPAELQLHSDEQGLQKGHEQMHEFQQTLGHGAGLQGRDLLSPCTCHDLPWLQYDLLDTVWVAGSNVVVIWLSAAVVRMSLNTKEHNIVC